MSTKVLLVDDEGTVLKSLNRALNASYDVTTAYSAEEALTLISGRRFAVVVTDMRMPGGDGMWLIDQASQRSPSTKFIVLTGNCDPLSRESVEKSGKAYAFLTKPCSIEQIETSIEGALMQHEEERQALV